MSDASHILLIYIETQCEMIKNSRASRSNTTYMHVSTISYVCEVQSDVSLVSLCCPQIVTAFVDAVYRSSGSTTHEFEAGVHVTVPSHSIDLDVYLCCCCCCCYEKMK